MQTVTIPPFKVIGIKVRTSNATGQAANDIGQLWDRFMTENIQAKIPYKVDMEILSIYANYEGDHMQPYDTILCCRVSSLKDIPEGMVGQAFEGGTYAKFPCKGDLTKGVVYGAWLSIWEQDLQRDYIADYEVYGEKASNPTNAELDIFVGITQEQ